VRYALARVILRSRSEHIATERSEVISHTGEARIYRICKANISLLGITVEKKDIKEFAVQ